jgi:hypothetical protein
VGIGSSVAFLGSAKVINKYFEQKYHNLLLGLTFAIGLFGGMLMSPVEILYNYIGYNYMLLTMISLAVLIVVALYSIKETDIPKIVSSGNKASVSIKNIFSVLSNPIILSVAILSGLMVGPLSGFGDNWAMSYIEQVYCYSASESYFLGLSAIYFGMSAGGPILGWYADRTKSLCNLIALCGMIMAFIFAILFYFNHMSYISTFILMTTLGVLCAYQLLSFSLVGKLIDPRFSGLATGIINTFILAFGYIMHMILGFSVERAWDGAKNEVGQVMYNKTTLVYGLLPVPVLCMIGAIGFLLLSAYIRYKRSTKATSDVINYSVD